MADRPPEFALITQVFAPLASHASALGLSDDACLLQPPAGCDVVVTTDALVEGVHFLSGDPPASIAKKSLRVNLSDLAAKGAEPLGYLLALSLPDRLTLDWIQQFADGLSADQQLFGVPLLGGDTTRTPGPLTIAITALGQVSHGGMIRRAGAVPGDGVYVSGTIGDAGAGLALLTQAQDTGPLVDRYRMPSPRLALGRALRGVASASIDVSDGLLADLGHIADVSQVRIVVEAGRVPCSAALKVLWGDSNDAVVRAATAGDDYEIAFTAGSETQAAEASVRSGIPVTRIGCVEKGAGIALVQADGREIPVPRPGFTHF
jgi:thiamine-monophosphate kinase